MARFCPLFSGSSGNCLYIGTPRSGLLVDAGVSARRIEQALLARDIDPATIRGILVTHEHTDHTVGLRVLHKRFGIPVYASFGTCRGLEEIGALPREIGRGFEGTLELDEFSVTSFHTSHDCLESTGFRIRLEEGRTVGIATDLGVVTDEVRRQLQGCDLIHIESNHDIRMLENGSYPYALKRRILSKTGHLSNEACAAELPALVEAGTTRIFLGHLSKENNMPALAHATSNAALQQNGMRDQVDYLLRVAPAEHDQPPIFF